MTRHPVRRLAAATILATLAAVTAARAQAPGLPPPPQNVVSLSATASAQVPQDWLTVVLATTREGADPAALQAQLKQALDAALSEARRAAAGREPQALEVQTGGFSLSPRYGRDGRMSGWSGRAELVLQGRDTAAIAQLAGRIQTLSVASTGFSLSREGREKVESQVVAEAIARFRTRADEVGRAFGFGSWSLREVNVQTDSPMVPPMARMRVAAAMAPPADEPLPVEAGKATVSVTVSGSIALAPR
ncbi:MAG: SIMPL domain-containing protein [Burkholderiaceae bacterium]|jgi:predicted secreted protein|nr:SIMPL domain-containing protein [Burkholderiaceae bacterium]MCZ8174798.1 SIMPL domain-containing protein [Burkholderiaceae bacterium]